MKYFSIQELCRSNTAVRLGIDNSPTGEVRMRLTALIENILDPLRAAWGAPIIVTSGYRCPALNRAVIRTLTDSRADNKRLLDLLLRLKLPLDQVINEYPDSQGRPDWIHVSYTTRRANRGSRLVAVRQGGKTVYKTF